MAWQLRKVIENKKEEYIMQDKSKVIFNNEIDRKAYRKAINSKKKYARKYGDDSNADYKVTIKKNKYIGDMLGVYDVRVADKPASVSNGNKEEFDTDKGIIVGNIRMGFGHTEYQWRLLQQLMHLDMFLTGWILILTIIQPVLKL